MNAQDFVSYETAKALKQAGFDWNTQSYFAVEPDGKPDLWVSGLGDIRNIDLKGRDVLAPSLAQAHKWLRTEKNIDIMIDRSFSVDNGYHYCILVNKDFENIIQQESKANRTYESALEEGIKTVLELIENNKIKKS